MHVFFAEAPAGISSIFSPGNTSEIPPNIPGKIHAELPLGVPLNVPLYFLSGFDKMSSKDTSRNFSTGPLRNSFRIKKIYISTEILLEISQAIFFYFFFFYAFSKYSYKDLLGNVFIDSTKIDCRKFPIPLKIPKTAFLRIPSQSFSSEFY